jgi:hypothetical protein
MNLALITLLVSGHQIEAHYQLNALVSPHCSKFGYLTEGDIIYFIAIYDDAMSKQMRVLLQKNKILFL